MIDLVKMNKVRLKNQYLSIGQDYLIKTCKNITFFREK